MWSGISTWDKLIGVKIEEKFFCSRKDNEVYELLTNLEIPNFDIYIIDKNQQWLRFESPFKLEAYPDLIDIKVTQKDNGTILHFKVRKGHLLGIFNHMKKNYSILLLKIKEKVDLKELS